MREMPVSMFDEWFEHYLEEPFGYEVDVHKHSEVCAIMANGLLAPKRAYKCSDFHFPPKVAELVGRNVERYGDDSWWLKIKSVSIFSLLKMKNL